MSQLEKVQYTAKAHTTDGRDGAYRRGVIMCAVSLARIRRGSVATARTACRTEMMLAYG